MLETGFLKPAVVAGLALFVLAANASMTFAGDGKGTDLLSASRKVFSSQRAKSTSNPDRQLGLVRSRLESTRGARIKGRNVNSSALAMRFTGETVDKSARYETKNLLAPEEARRTRRTAVWLGGDVTLDSARAENPRLATVYTNGLAFGVDRRVAERLLVGNAIGVAFDRTGIGEEGSLRTRYLSNTLYGSLTTSPDTYLDLILGASQSEFAGNPGIESFSARHRSATQAFGQARFSREFEQGRLRVRSYGQARYLHSRFSAYSADAGEAYSFAPSSSDALEVMLGVRSETSAKTRAGKVAPHAVLEVSRTLKRSSGAVVSSIEGVEDVMGPSSNRSGRLSARTGLNWAFTERANVNGEYSISSSLDAFDTRQKVSARFKLTF